MSDRLERNYRMANSASENRTRPATKEYLDNYDSIFRKKKKTPAKKKSAQKPKLKHYSLKQLSKLAYSMYGIE